MSTEAVKEEAGLDSMTVPELKKALRSIFR